MSIYERIFTTKIVPRRLFKKEKEVIDLWIFRIIEKNYSLGKWAELAKGIIVELSIYNNPWFLVFTKEEGIILQYSFNKELILRIKMEEDIKNAILEHYEGLVLSC